MNEYEVVVKAICSGNASAILTSDQLSQPQKSLSARTGPGLPM
ncbi:hypothetical protein P4S72_24930 [Vibrio sp. PP-XX7]